MSVVVFGLALGLNATSPVITADMNPHMLVADRHYQELVYQDRPVFRVTADDIHGLVLRQKARVSKRAETDPVTDVR